MHEAARYASDDEFLSVAVPFVRAGVDADERTIVACRRRTVELLRRAFDGADIRYVPPAIARNGPGVAVRTGRAACHELLDSGAVQVRLLDEMPRLTTAGDRRRWARYDAIVTRAYLDLPLQTLLLQDTRILVAPRDEPDEDLVETQPAIVVLDPTPRVARAALSGTTVQRTLRREHDGLLLSVSEVVTNALVHGLPPVTMRVWLGDDRVVVTVSDSGRGVSDPLTGWTPPRAQQCGHGLWIANLLCSEVALSCDESGFSVRLTMMASLRRTRRWSRARQKSGNSM